MSKQRTQVERVIRAADTHRGVCQVDFLAPDVIDGGPPITRLAARLWDAEQWGCVFECIGRRSGCKVWRLVSKPDDVERTASGVPDLAGISIDEGTPQVNLDGGSASGSLNAGVEGGGGVHLDGEPANPSARRPVRSMEHAGTTVALSVDVDDGRGEGQAQSLSPGHGALPAAVVSTGRLFEVEPPQPQSPYDPMSEAA